MRNASIARVGLCACALRQRRRAPLPPAHARSEALGSCAHARPRERSPARRGGGGWEERGHPRAPGCIVGRRRQRPGRAGGAAAAAAVNPPGRSQHCGAAAPARPRPARPSWPSRLRLPAPPPRARPGGAGRPAGPAPLPGPAGRPCCCPDEAGRGGLDRPVPGRPCRTSAPPRTAHGRARSPTWPSSGSLGTRPGR